MPCTGVMYTQHPEYYTRLRRQKRTFFHCRSTIFRGSLRLSSLGTWPKIFSRWTGSIDPDFFPFFHGKVQVTVFFHSLVFWVDNFLCLFALAGANSERSFSGKRAWMKYWRIQLGVFIDKRHHFLVSNANDRGAVVFYFLDMEVLTGNFRVVAKMMKRRICGIWINFSLEDIFRWRAFWSIRLKQAAEDCSLRYATIS